MMTNLYLQFPEDFEGRYNVHKAAILGVQKPAEVKEEKRQSKNRDMLVFYPTTGDMEYKCKLGVVKNGNKDYVLLDLLHKNKNTPFTIEDIKKYCNPLVNKDAHKFKGEKDVDDTLRQIRFKLEVEKGAFFPLVKKGEKGNKKWLWIEK